MPVLGRQRKRIPGALWAVTFAQLSNGIRLSTAYGAMLMTVDSKVFLSYIQLAWESFFGSATCCLLRAM